MQSQLLKDTLAMSEVRGFICRACVLVLVKQNRDSTLAWLRFPTSVCFNRSHTREGKQFPESKVEYTGARIPDSGPSAVQSETCFIVPIVAMPYAAI